MQNAFTQTALKPIAMAVINQIQTQTQDVPPTYNLEREQCKTR